MASPLELGWNRIPWLLRRPPVPQGFCKSDLPTSYGAAHNSTHSGPFPVTSPQPPPSRPGSWVESNFPGPTDLQGGSVQAQAAEAGGAGRTRRARRGQGYSHFPLAAHPSRLARSRKTENRYCDPTTSPGCFPAPEATRPGGPPVPFSQGKEGVRG